MGRLYLLRRRKLESGATALIIVIFSVLLLTTVSVGFMRLVSQDQNRSLNDELSRGAYDAAMAGVEDGKRVLEACRQDPGGDACSAIDNRRCDTVAAADFVSTEGVGGEVMLRSEGGADGGFDQAYTCVVVDLQTDDFKGKIDAFQTKIVPMDIVGSSNRIEIAWFKKAQFAGSPTNVPFSPGFPSVGSWNEKMPPILRAELITYNRSGNITLSQLGSSGSSGTAGMNTVYLYPVSHGVSAANSFTRDSHARGGNSNNLIINSSCGDTTDATYWCKSAINLPREYSTSGATGLLRLTSLYNSADFSVRVIGAKFDGVQPKIDSTGRAANIFRRVEARVEHVSLNDDWLYPRAAVDITGNFCKAYSVPVTDNYSYTSVFPLSDCQYGS